MRSFVLFGGTYTTLPLNMNGIYVVRRQGETKPAGAFSYVGPLHPIYMKGLLSYSFSEILGGEAADYNRQIFYHRKIAIPEEFQDGALDYDFAYEFVQLKGQDGKPIDAVYPKTYSLNNVYAQEQVFDGQTYYYLGYLYKYKKDSEDLLYFTVDENSGSYQTKTAYKYKYDSFNKSGTFNSYKFYLYNPYHSEVIEKPMMTYSGKKLDFEDAISTESVTEDGGESVKYGVANYPPLTDSNYANSAYTFSINFRNVGNDNLTYSYSNTQYNVGNGAVGISDSDASGWISFDMDNERVTITPQVSNPEALKSFSTYVTVTDAGLLRGLILQQISPARQHLILLRVIHRTSEFIKQV